MASFGPWQVATHHTAFVVEALHRPKRRGITSVAAVKGKKVHCVTAPCLRTAPFTADLWEPLQQNAALCRRDQDLPVSI